MKISVIKPIFFKENLRKLKEEAEKLEQSDSLQKARAKYVSSGYYILCFKILKLLLFAIRVSANCRGRNKSKFRTTEGEIQ